MPAPNDLFGVDHPGSTRPAMLFSTGVERHSLFRRPDQDGSARGRGRHLHLLFASTDAPV
jgi:hypothetical protein